LKTRDFYFELPPHLIAQHPLPERTASKMLVYDRKTASIRHDQFIHLPDCLKPGDLLVFNDSKVLQARLFGQKASGGQIEILVERLLSPYVFLAHIRASKTPKPGTMLMINEDVHFIVKGKQNHLYECEAKQPIDRILETLGHVPLPPYIERKALNEDKARYQTIYAKTAGSVAAPTAGLHFDEAILAELKKRNIEMAFTTLHVGAGTFQPVRTETIAEHKMHAEWLEVSQSCCDAVNQAKAAGRRVIAVGSTALRALESAAQDKKLHVFAGETTIFITPGYEFQIIDGLITNFHLPESTLLMMVAAFIGYDNMMKLYQAAIHESYRFFSYGDVSLLT
jgi:S-adenosylmethionine:tRNA ribosyltransferase-isomerase